MSNTKEIKAHINSIKETQKITNAMYLIASTKMQKAKRNLDRTRPYFDAIKAEVKRIFRSVDDSVENIYLYPTVHDVQQIDGTYAYLVITADKGLAGAYNMNIIKKARQIMEEHGDYKLFVVGEYGRQYFSKHKFDIEQSFLYSAQNPTFQRAREICSVLMNLYNNREITKIYVIYTDYGNSMSTDVNVHRLIPLHKAQFGEHDLNEEIKHIDFEPNVEAVLKNVIPSYVEGFVYSALVDSFCCEQNSRMTAMDSANKNAEKLLDKMMVEYNHVRQSTITQEITEVSSGAKFQRMKKESMKEGQL